MLYVKPTCYLNLKSFLLSTFLCALLQHSHFAPTHSIECQLLTHFLLRNSIESDTLWISECFAHCTAAVRRESIAASVVGAAAAAPNADRDHFSVSLCDIDLMVVD